METKLSKNFTLQEMINSSTAKARGIDNTPTDKVVGNLQSLCHNILQPLRDAYGKPIIVTSGYRCAKLNKTVGGAATSDHMYGNAADIHSKSDSKKENKELFDLAVRMMQEGKLKNVKQIIDEYNYNWVHISWQDGRTSKRNQVLHLK